MPLQLVACRGRNYYRITESLFQVFEVSSRTLPPQIRGSAVARQITEAAVAEPLNVVALENGSVLVIAKHNVFRYEPGEKAVRPGAPIPTPGPLLVWPDAHASDSFWTRAEGDQNLYRYSLTTNDGPDRNSQSASAKVALPGFDSRLFTVLHGGAPLYSTPKGLSRLEDDSPVAPFPEPSGPANILFADVSENHYWAADASGNLGLWDQKRGDQPVFKSRVPGSVIGTVIEGTRVAVLSMELSGQNYRPSVTIFSKGEQLGKLSIAPSSATFGQPELDLCLIEERPWVVVGGRHWIQLLDWTSPRLLAEW